MILYNNFIYVIIVFIISILLYIHLFSRYSIEFFVEHQLYNNMKKKNNLLIIYKTFTGCGLGNKIPTIYSSIFFSIVSHSTFYIFGWKDLVKYFKIPLFLLNDNISIKNIITIRSINHTIKNILNYYRSITIYKYHGFMDVIYNLYKNADIISSNKLNVIEWTRVIQYVFLKPCKEVQQYLFSFLQKKRRKKVIAVHIRTGFLSNLSMSSYWYSPVIYKKYKRIVNELLDKYKDYKLMVLSDSDNLIKDFSKIYSQYLINYTVSGPITNPHYSMHGMNYTGGIKLLTDNFLISKCDIAVGTHFSTYFSLACSRSTVKCIKI